MAGAQAPAPDFSTILDASAAEDSAFLDLIAPRDLPAELALSPERRDRLRPVLASFLKGLDEPDPRLRAERIVRLLQDFGPGVDVRSAEIGHTGITEDQEGVADFDAYFCVRRIVDGDVAGALVRSLLQGAAAVLTLSARAPSMPNADIAAQIDGFASHAMLLGRIFDLGDIA